MQRKNPCSIRENLIVEAKMDKMNNMKNWRNMFENLSIIQIETGKLEQRLTIKEINQPKKKRKTLKALIPYKKK